MDVLMNDYFFVFDFLVFNSITVVVPRAALIAFFYKKKQLFQELLDSGLTWSKTDYHGADINLFSQSDDPLIKEVRHH